MSGRRDHPEVQSLYASSYRRLVRVVGTVVGDRAGAEEAVQEAFAQLLLRGDVVLGYDDPEAWVRHVAIRFALKSARKSRNLAAALHRLPDPEPAAAEVEDALDIEAALSRLPAKQRAVVVLHLLGHSQAAIAAVLDIPVGTVKSRFSKARHTLGPLLSPEGAA